MENTDLQSVVRQYRGDGYEVVVHPAQDDLPQFLSGFKPDLVARKEGESVVVDVVTKDKLNKRKHFLEYWVGKINTQPGWRLDLVITDPSPWADKVAPDARERDIEDVRERNREVRRSLEGGSLEPSCLFAWALVESAMRIAAARLELPLKNKTPSYVMKQLATAAVISAADLETLQRLMTVRNSIAHGLTTARLDGDVVREMTAMTDDLLAVAESAKRGVVAVGGPSGSPISA